MDILRGQRAYVIGDFEDIRIHDLSSLEEFDRIVTNTEELNSLVSVGAGEHDSGLLATSRIPTWGDSSCTLICAYERRALLMWVPGVTALESLSLSSLSSNPCVMGLGGFAQRVSIFDVVSCENVCLLHPNALSLGSITQIRCFPWWSMTDVLFAGVGMEAQSLSGHRVVRHDMARNATKALFSIEEDIHGGQDYSQEVNALAVSIDRGLLISGTGDEIGHGCLRLWSLDSCECVESISLDRGCHSLSCCEDLNLICVGTTNVVEIYDIRNTKQRIRVVGQIGRGDILAFDRIQLSSWFVSGSYDFLSIWNPTTGKIQERGVEGRVCGVTVLPNEERDWAADRRDELERIQFVFEKCSADGREMIEVERERILIFGSARVFTCFWLLGVNF